MEEMLPKEMIPKTRGVAPSMLEKDTRFACAKNLVLDSHAVGRSH
jgi:hypothetical protein